MNVKFLSVPAPLVPSKEGEIVVRTLFTPSSAIVSRLSQLAIRLSSLGNLIMYEGQTEIIMEAGETGRALTVFVYKDKYTMMYRKTVDSFRTVIVNHIPYEPGVPDNKISIVAMDYHNAIIEELKQGIGSTN